MLFKNEDPDALGIIDECFRYMELQTGKPDLLIHLQCSPEEQMKRIKGRNRDHEKGVTLEYITELKEQLDHLVDTARKDGYVVWDIDTESVYLPGNTKYAMELTMKIADRFNIRLDKTMKESELDKTSEDVAPVVEYVRLAEAV